MTNTFFIIFISIANDLNLIQIKFGLKILIQI